VYVAAPGSTAVAVFDRAPDGALTQKPGAAGCVSDTGSGPCADGVALVSSNAVTVSPDDRSVYVSASGNSDAIAVFDRAPDGTLVQKPGAAGCVSSTELGVRGCARSTTLGDASSVTISPDGRSVYATSQATDGAVTSFDRAPNGTLTQKPGGAGCISDTGAGACSDGDALSLAFSVTVSPDGTSAYVASEGGGIAVFDRAADGTLTQKKPGRAGCISGVETGPCTKAKGLRGAFAVTVSPGGENVYATSLDAVAVFDRAADGTLTQKPGMQGCISDSGDGPCVRGAALAGAGSVTVSPDGNTAYVASGSSRGLAIFDRLATMPPAPAPDTAKPLLTGLEIFPTSLRAGGVRPTTGPRRDSLQYILSEPASVRFTIARVLRGRRVDGRCVDLRRPSRRKTSCSRYASVRGAFTDLGETGDNDVGFKGRLPARSLAPGRYRLRAIATDAAGNASAPKHAGFRVIRGRRGRRP